MKNIIAVFIVSFIFSVGCSNDYPFQPIDNAVSIGVEYDNSGNKIVFLHNMPVSDKASITFLTNLADDSTTIIIDGIDTKESSYQQWIEIKDAKFMLIARLDDLKAKVLTSAVLPMRENKQATFSIRTRIGSQPFGHLDNKNISYFREYIALIQ